MIWKAVEPEPGVYDDGYLRHIAASVRTLARHGIFSLSRRGARILEIAACRGIRRISIQALRAGRDRESCRAAEL